MKAIVETFTDKPLWLKYEQSPYTLCMLGKYIVDFTIDYCLLCKVTDITFVFEKYDKKLLNHLKRYSGSELNITAKLRDNFPKTEYRSDDEDVIVFHDCCFICYDKRTNGKSEALAQIRKCFPLRVSECGIEIFSKEHIDLPDYVALEHPSVADFFEITMELLKNYIDCFSINGYAVENNIHLGMFDAVMPDTTFIPNVIVANNVMIGKNCRIGPNVIIGHNSVIADGCVIKNTLVAPLSYVGKIDVDGKIISKYQLIDPATGQRKLLADTLDYLSPTDNILFKLFNRIWAVLLLVLLLPFSIPFLIFGAPKKFEYVNFKKAGKVVKVKIFHKDKNSLIDKYFFKFSQDKIPRLFLAMLGKLDIVGDSMISVKYPQNLKFYGEYFEPAVFACPDS